MGNEVRTFSVIVYYLSARDNQRQTNNQGTEENMNQPIILCGLGRIGGKVLEFLRTAGLPVVVIDTQCSDKDPRLEGIRLICGDCRRPEVLAQADLDHARGVLILTSDDLVNVSTALTIRNLHPEVRIVVRMFNQDLISRLGKAVHNVTALSTSTLTAPLFALTALTGQALGTFRIHGLSDGRRQVGQLVVEAGSPLVGRSVRDVASCARAQPIAHLPAGRWLNDINPEAHLAAGDRLVLCGEACDLAPLLAQQGEDAAPHVRWAGWLRRQARALRRTVGEMDTRVKVGGGILLVIVAFSTIVFEASVRKFGFADAFFRAVSILATGSDMHEEHLDAPWQKVFAGVLRILGQCLMAGLTAIVTNYLLRMRLGGALEVRRIPDGGHVVVCGLGSVGFRIAEELLAAGERVVAIERSTDGRFVATARRLGLAVIIGDAKVAEVLRQARAGTARAVIAATSADLINLEIALLVRELNPHQRVVLRLADADLARTLREAADVRLALSIAALAAPAFVAAVFGDRILSIFPLEGRLLAVIDLLIGEKATVLVGQPARVVAVDYGLLPVAVLRRDNASEQPLAARLASGDRLIGIIALPDLQRLLRRESPPRDWGVEVDAIPLPTRPWVATLLRARQGLAAEEAEKALNQLPLRLATGRTRGEAEELLAQLARERVSARVTSAVNASA
jgi:Trk K+ transport system NAD-binding subunit